MQFSINKAKATAIIVTILMVTSIAVMALPVQAQEGGETAHGGQPDTGIVWQTTVPAGETPAYRVTSLPFLSFRPNPIGLGQELLINMWLTFPSAENRYCAGYTVDITKPDGETDKIGPLNSYVADGTAWATYVVDQIGDWTFKFSFPGQWFPAGRYYNGIIVTNTSGTLYPAIYYEPVSTPELTLTVQTEAVLSWYSPLPTDYWTRPILPNNREWNVIAGNYPWPEQQIPAQWSTRDDYLGPYITAPNTPHIVWKRLGAIAGIMGGDTGVYATLAAPSAPGFFGGGGTISPPNVIYMGRCYATYYKPGVGNVAGCYDLRTGEIYYEIAVAQGGITPNHIAYWAGVDTAVPGAGEAATFGVELIVVSGTRLYKVNPLTGAMTVNATIPSFTTAEMAYRNGYYLSYNRTGTPGTANERGTLYNWSAQGSSSNFNSRLANPPLNVTIPHSFRATSVSDLYGTLGAYDTSTGITVVQSRFLYGNVYGYRLEAVSLVTGQSLWNFTSSSSEMSSAYRPTNGWARHGIYAAQMERGYWQAWDIRTGHELWKTEMNDYPWGEFWMYDEAAYDNLLIGTGYTGVWALDETTGDVVWHYADPAITYETPYTSNSTPTYSIQDIEIADGKVFVTNNEHTPTQPATRGWGLICLNVTNGELIYKLNGANMVAQGASDGYIVATSSYSGHLYVLGKGKSQTTVTAPQTAVAKDSKVLIQGTVLDMSPAQPGTACVSDESMDTWMDYLHHQMPADGYYHNVTVTGVPVMLTAIDSNGNPINIGTTMSDNTGSYQIEWKPTAEGLYKIHAAFIGTDSYGSSIAETGLSVGPAPAETPTPLQPVPIDYTWTIIGAAIAIIVVVVLVGVLIIMRKH